MRRAPAQWIASPASDTPPTAGSADQHFAFRAVVTLTKTVKRATLYATGQDTVGAWVNVNGPISFAGTPNTIIGNAAGDRSVVVTISERFGKAILSIYMSILSPNQFSISLNFA